MSQRIWFITGSSPGELGPISRAGVRRRRKFKGIRAAPSGSCYPCTHGVSAGKAGQSM
jgi:hypothetical protein